MPYATGEIPTVGDIVADSRGRVGTVTHLIHYGGPPEELVIKWDDGTVGIRYSRFDRLKLIERVNEETASQDL